MKSKKGDNLVFHSGDILSNLSCAFMTATLPDDCVQLVQDSCWKGASIIKSEVFLPEGISDIAIERVQQKDFESRTIQILKEWMKQKELKRIIVSCSGSAEKAAKLKNAVDAALGGKGNLETYLIKSTKNGEELEETLRAITKLQSERCSNDPITIFFTTSLLSSGIDCDVDAVLSVGGTFSVAECFQFLGRLCRKPGSKGVAIFLYCPEFWEQHLQKNGSDDKLYTILENGFGEGKIQPFKKFLGCNSFKALMTRTLEEGNCFINTLNGLMNANELLFKERCNKICSCCKTEKDGEEKEKGEYNGKKKKMSRSSVDSEVQLTVKRGRESQEQDEQVNQETNVINFYKNRLKTKIRMTRIQCFVCKSETAGYNHYPNNCEKIRNLVFRNKKNSCGQCGGDEQHRLDDVINCLQLDSKTSPICIYCFRNKDECRTESCTHKPIWKTSRHVLMFVYHKKEIFEGLTKKFPTFERAKSFKQFFEICTKEQFGTPAAKFPKMICVLYFVLTENLISL